MPDITLCRAKPTSNCRKTCLRYRAIPKAHSQSYADYDTGMGLRCESRIDINNATTPIQDWRVVDLSLSKTHA